MSANSVQIEAQISNKADNPPNSNSQNDPIVEEWLSAQTKKSTRYQYKRTLKLYKEFTQKTGDELIEAKRNDRNYQVEASMLLFRKWLIEKGYAETYCKTAVGGVCGFYRYHRMPLSFRPQESKRLTEANRKTSDYRFDLQDLTSMALAGSLKERYVLIVGKSLGLRAGDFLNLKFGQFRVLKLDNEAPIFLGEISTTKEKVRAFPFLDSDAIPIVKAWLQAHKEAKDSERVLQDEEDNLSIILQTLCHKAGMAIENGQIHEKRVRFHCLRKFLIDHLSAYSSESQWKQIVGKAISEGAYVSQSQLRSVYARATMDTLIDCNNVKTKQLSDLQNAMNQLEGENSGFKTRIEGLQKQTQQLEDQLGNLNSAIDFIRLEDIIRFVSAKCPLREEMFDYLSKRHIDPAILKRVELTCLIYDERIGRWHFLPEYDVCKIAS
jgi:hypothetical protein